jgi:hypothetical protein
LAGGKVSRDAGPVKGGTSVIAFVDDPTGYKWELIERKGSNPEPIAQVPRHLPFCLPKQFHHCVPPCPTDGRPLLTLSFVGPPFPSLLLTMRAYDNVVVCLRNWGQHLPLMLCRIYTCTSGSESCARVRNLSLSRRYNPVPLFAPNLTPQTRRCYPQVARAGGLTLLMIPVQGPILP